METTSSEDFRWKTYIFPNVFPRLPCCVQWALVEYPSADCFARLGVLCGRVFLFPTS